MPLQSRGKQTKANEWLAQRSGPALHPWGPGICNLRQMADPKQEDLEPSAIVQTHKDHMNVLLRIQQHHWASCDCWHWPSRRPSPPTYSTVPPCTHPHALHMLPRPSARPLPLFPDPHSFSVPRPRGWPRLSLGSQKDAGMIISCPEPLLFIIFPAGKRVQLLQVLALPPGQLLLHHPYAQLHAAHLLPELADGVLHLRLHETV